MTVRVGRLNGQNLNYLDYDVSTIDTALVNPGIISGMKVVAGKVQVGRALMQVTRTSISPDQTFLVHVEVSEEENIDTTGTKKVWIEVNQLNINNGTLATDPTGAGIAKIIAGTSYPSSNFLPLASITGGVVTDERIFIKGKNVMRTGGTPGILQFDASGNEVSNSTLPSSVIDFIAQHSTISNTITEKSGYTITGTLGENITGIVPVVKLNNVGKDLGRGIPQLTSNYQLVNGINFTSSKGSFSGHDAYSVFNDTWINDYRLYCNQHGAYPSITLEYDQSITVSLVRIKAYRGKMNTNTGIWNKDAQGNWNKVANFDSHFGDTETKQIQFSPVESRGIRVVFYNDRNYGDTNVYNIYINKAEIKNGVFMANASQQSDYQKVVGFAKGPKNQGDTVDVPVSEFAPIKGMSGLTSNTLYYLGNIPGTLSTSPGSHKRIVGYTLDDPTVLITYNGKYLPGSNLVKDIT